MHCRRPGSWVRVPAAGGGSLVTGPGEPTILSASAIGSLDAFIQELPEPVEHATVTATASAAMAIALFRGKAVATGRSGATPTIIVLQAPAIDEIVVYVVSPITLTICVFDRFPGDDPQWSSAVKVVEGLTLPLRECDPRLATPAEEYAAAKARLVGGEALVESDFQRMAATLRSAAGSAIGRRAAMTSLMRADASQRYEEMPFDTQLGALALHPKARRMLGFGFADRQGLVAGHAYVYRVIGRFDAADSRT